MVERQPGELAASLADDWLAADRPVLVDVEVEDCDAAVVRDTGEYCRAVRRPLYVADRHTEVEHEQWFPSIVLFFSIFRNIPNGIVE